MNHIILIFRFYLDIIYFGKGVAGTSREYYLIDYNAIIPADILTHHQAYPNIFFVCLMLSTKTAIKKTRA